MEHRSDHGLPAVTVSRENTGSRHIQENLQSEEVNQLHNDDGPMTVAGVELLGVATFATGTKFAGTEIGGLSGITYDPQRNVYYVVSDDGSVVNPARFYTVDIDLSDGNLDKGDVTFQTVTTLLDETGVPFARRRVDAESIELLSDETVVIASEGKANPTKRIINPFIRRFNLSGQQVEALPIPPRFLPNDDVSSGTANNRGFEGLTITPDGKDLYAAMETALAQDEPVVDLNKMGPSRVLQYRLNPAEPIQEYVYVTGMPPVVATVPSAEGDTGLVALEALDNHGTFLTLERPFAVNLSSIILFRLFETSTQGATDVSSINSLEGDDVSFVSMYKRLVLDFADLGVRPENREGMALGPRLPDGRRVLILVSDNNFKEYQVTQFVALALDLERAPAR